MVNLRTLAILLTLFLPILFGVLFTFIKRRYIKGIILMQLGMTSICLLLVLWQGPFEWSSGLAFFEELIYFNFSSTPILLFLIGQLSLFLIIINKSEDETFSRIYSIILNAGLASGFIAFFSGQFMIRYIALEIIGLCTALSSLTSISDLRGYKNFGLILVFLRLGDLGLWSAILMLQNYTGSLDISKMISAANQLNPQNQGWVIAGLLLAVAVKTGLWPFGLWLQSFKYKEPRWINWLPKILMPSLGLYLLHRTRPILQSQDTFILIIAIAIVCLVVVLDLAHRLQWFKISRQRLIYNLMIGMSIYLSLFSSSSILSYEIFVVLILTTLFLLEYEYSARYSHILVGFAVLFLNMAIGIPGLQGQSIIIVFVWVVMSLVVLYWTTQNQFAMWARNILLLKSQGHNAPPPIIAEAKVDLEQRLEGIYAKVQWIYQQTEISFFSQVFSFASKTLVKIADWTAVNVEMGLEKVWAGLSSGVVKISQTTFNQVEMRIEDALVKTSKALVRLSKTTLIKFEDGGSKKASSIIQKMIGQLGQYEENSQNRSFRWDLLWVPLVLVVILIFLVISQRG